MRRPTLRPAGRPRPDPPRVSVRVPGPRRRRESKERSAVEDPWSIPRGDRGGRVPGSSQQAGAGVPLIPAQAVPTWRAVALQRRPIAAAGYAPRQIAPPAGGGKGAVDGGSPLQTVAAFCAEPPAVARYYPSRDAPGVMRGASRGLEAIILARAAHQPTKPGG